MMNSYGEENKQMEHANKILVAVFSKTGNTMEMARQIKEATGGDLFEIVPATPYPVEYRAVVAVRRGGATHVFDSINHMFQITSMIVPGSLYWNFGVGRDKGEVLDDDDALRNMNHLGQTIAWLGKAMAAEATPFPKQSIGLE